MDEEKQSVRSCCGLSIIESQWEGEWISKT